MKCSLLWGISLKTVKKWGLQLMLKKKRNAIQMGGCKTCSSLMTRYLMKLWTTVRQEINLKADIDPESSEELKLDS